VPSKKRSTPFGSAPLEIAEPDPELKLDLEPEPDPGAEPETDPVPEPEPESKPEPEQKSEPAPRPRPARKPREKTKSPVVEPDVKEFLWSGQTRYRCSRCPYDAGTQVEAYNHFIRNHAPAPAPPVQQIDTGLVTSAGEKIVRLEEAPNGENTTDGS